jgi:hypothetical protein
MSRFQLKDEMCHPRRSLSTSGYQARVKENNRERKGLNGKTITEMSFRMLQCWHHLGLKSSTKLGRSRPDNLWRWLNPLNYCVAAESIIKRCAYMY